MMIPFSTAVALFNAFSAGYCAAVAVSTQHHSVRVILACLVLLNVTLAVSNLLP